MSSFENTPDSSYDPNQPTTQTFEIHVRIKNTITNCIAPPQSFVLTVNPLPIIKNESWLVELCDEKELNLYKYILEENYDKEISSMNLLVLHPKYHTFFHLKIPLLKKETDFLIRKARAL